MYENHEWGELATPQDACREYALNAGRERPGSAWILTDFDTWMRNPFYSGPPVPHPEDWYDEQLQLEQEREDDRLREAAQLSADEEEAVREFNRDFSECNPAPDLDLGQDDLPF